MEIALPKTLIVVPTYNEAENIERLVSALLSLPVPDLSILIVDDNSPDGTGKIADSLAAQQPERVYVIHREGKQGLGTAYLQGFRWALERGYEAIGQMDADFSHNPDDVPRLLAALDRADAVIGSRYVTGGRLDERWSIWRRLLSWWANRVWVGLILNSPVHDNTGGFRMWRRETLLGMDLDRIRSNGYVFQVEITYLALRLGYRFAEVPIYFADRKYGRSKMGLRIQLEAAIGVLKVRHRYRSLTAAQRARHA
ncbi:MAG: polyprenol monophosphomannose synthase [Chloroflexota bacterium]|nr:MAG: polyprenol monophosphomannose synthase [Chloroflexota bacterium]